MMLIECIPNFSEGRNPATMEAIVDAIRQAGVTVADWSADPDHHRMVVTFLGAPEAVAEAAFAGAREAVRRIDLNRHQGAHPRFGAVDVIPFVPLGETPMAACVTLARSVGERLGRELSLPVYYYEEAATRPERRNLARVRAGGFEALAAAPLEGDRAPDAGPARCHPTAGAVAVGARGPLLAYNVLLDTQDVEIARAIAARLREQGGGPPGVKALGLFLPSRGCTQLSMNLTDPDRVSLDRVFALVRQEAARHGVAVIDSELVGTLRLDDLLAVARAVLGLRNLKRSQVLDLYLAPEPILEGTVAQNARVVDQLVGYRPCRRRNPFARPGRDRIGPERSAAMTTVVLYAADLEEMRRWVGSGDAALVREGLAILKEDQEADWEPEELTLLERLLNRMVMEGRLYESLPEEEAYYLTQLLIDLFDELVESEAVSDELPMLALEEALGPLRDAGGPAGAAATWLTRGRRFGGDDPIWSGQGEIDDLLPYFGAVTREELPALVEALQARFSTLAPPSSGGRRASRRARSGGAERLLQCVLEACRMAQERDLVSFVS